MMARRHFVMSLGLGLVGWQWSKLPATLPLAVALGTLVDLDHLTDYAWYFCTGEHRLILPLHGYEMMIPLLLAAKQYLGRRAAIVLVSSYGLHLLSDEMENCTKLGAYLLTWRIAKRFHFEALSRHPLAGIQGREDDLIRILRFLARLGFFR